MCRSATSPTGFMSVPLSWVAPQIHLLFDRHLGTDWPMAPTPARNLGRDQFAGRGRRAAQGESQQVLKGPDDQLRALEPPGLPRPAAVMSPTPCHRMRHASSRSSNAPHDRLRPKRFAALYMCAASGLILQDVQPADRDGYSVRPIRPIQIIFGGKEAHPEDRMGKELIQNIVRLTKQDQFGQPNRLRRRLRHERGARTTGPGSRRLAEQSAQATRSASGTSAVSRKPHLNG